MLVQDLLGHTGALATTRGDAEATAQRLDTGVTRVRGGADIGFGDGVAETDVHGVMSPSAVWVAARLST